MYRKANGVQPYRRTKSIVEELRSKKTAKFCKFCLVLQVDVQLYWNKYQEYPLPIYIYITEGMALQCFFNQTSITL